MHFFHLLHNQPEPLDVTLRIVKKGETLTIEVAPNQRTAMRHCVLTGTPAEIEDGFFDAIKLPEPTPGLQVQELPEAGEPTSAPSTPDKQPNKPAKGATKDKPKKEKAVKAKPAGKANEPSMFDAPAVEVDVETDGADQGDDEPADNE